MTIKERKEKQAKEREQILEFARKFCTPKGLASLFPQIRLKK